jgi:hypothetical protein
VPAAVERRFLDQDAWLRRARSDEVVFDLRLAAEWAELARLGDFQISLEDDRGTRWTPADIWSARGTSHSMETTYQTWRTMQRVQIGDRASGNRVWATWVPEEQPVRQLVYLGGGAVHFRAPALLRPETRALTLTLRSRARTLRFTWEFDSGPAHAALSRVITNSRYR